MKTLEIVEILKKLKKFKTKNPIGFSGYEIELFLKRLPEVSIKELYDKMGVVTVMVIKGQVLYYRQDVITALLCVLEKRDKKYYEWD
jgi:hypothetical protein